MTVFIKLKKDDLLFDEADAMHRIPRFELSEVNTSR